MLRSPIDQEDIKIRTDLKANYITTHFSFSGSVLSVEGYASIDKIFTTSEDRIRKMLVFVPIMDLSKIKNNNKDYQDWSEDEILKDYTLEFPMENVKFSHVKDNENSTIEDKNSLGGFKIRLDLSDLENGLPLKPGKYNVYIKLEQLLDNADTEKFVKLVPMYDIKSFLLNGLLSTKIYYFSPKKHLKYNLISLYDIEKKTLRFENSLSQSYNPKEFYDEDEGDKESKKIKALKRRFLKLCYIIFKLLPIDRKKISFVSDSREELNGNFYFVYEELMKRNLDLKLNLILNKNINSKKSFTDLIRMAYDFATSKIILLDDFYPLIYPIKIRKHTNLIQIWHAAGAFKTFGFSRMGKPGGPSAKSKNHRNYTKATVSSEGVREHYAEGFGIDIEKVYATGVPRSDVFFDESYKQYVSKRLYENYPFLKEKKVILFAPTFRGNGQASAYYPFNELNLKKLYENLSKEYVFLFKIHPFVNNKLSIPYEYSNFFYDFSDFREINDLLLITDLLITDYSSVCFEFALLNKPMLFFGFDVEEYIRKRDFYYDYFDFIPGPLVKSTEDIIEAIEKEDYRMEKIKPFVKYFFNGTLGNASKNVVDQVILPSLNGDDETDEEKRTFEAPASTRTELFDRVMKNSNDNK